MINDFDESILFSLPLIQSAIERVTILPYNVVDYGCLLSLKKICQLVVDIDDFNILHITISEMDEMQKKKWDK